VICAWCGNRLVEQLRRDALYCNQRCRQAAWRFGRGCVSRERAAKPIRLAYADPPYPGLSARYYRAHPDYAGEVDHRALLSRLQAFDGWALSTSSSALVDVLVICRELGLRPRVASWTRGPRPGRSAWPRRAWEPVVFAGGRRLPSSDVVDDALVWTSRPRLSDPKRVVGAKPSRFAFWLFGLLGALPGDELVDLFPGSGGITRAWNVYTVNPAVRGVAEDLSDGNDVDVRQEPLPFDRGAA
jgi:hypothetical protein